MRKIEHRKRSLIIIEARVRGFLAVRRYRHLYMGILKLRAISEKQLSALERIVQHLKADKLVECARLEDLRKHLQLTIMHVRHAAQAAADKPQGAGGTGPQTAGGKGKPPKARGAAISKHELHRLHKEHLQLLTNAMNALQQKLHQQNVREEEERLRKLQEEMERERRRKEEEERIRREEEEERKRFASSILAF